MSFSLQSDMTIPGLNFIIAANSSSDSPDAMGTAKCLDIKISRRHSRNKTPLCAMIILVVECSISNQ
jgi:amino acid transporter